MKYNYFRINSMDIKQEPSDLSEEYMVQQDNIEFSPIGFPYTVKNEISKDLFKADLANTDTNNYFVHNNSLDKECMEADVEDIKLEEEDKAEEVIVQNDIVIKDEFNEFEQVHVENQFFSEGCKDEPREGYYSESDQMESQESARKTVNSNAQALLGVRVWRRAATDKQVWRQKIKEAKAQFGL
uniref:Uncharacterized protein LOC114335095 n=1 Tax=Diabrotica virgifera virgifera TaxID=50390 RepID=A0A6P7FX75_DIAVI